MLTRRTDIKIQPIHPKIQVLSIDKTILGDDDRQ